MLVEISIATTDAEFRVELTEHQTQRIIRSWEETNPKIDLKEFFGPLGFNSGTQRYLKRMCIAIAYTSSLSVINCLIDESE
jgi:hypothetical protein